MALPPVPHLSLLAGLSLPALQVEIHLITLISSLSYACISNLTIVKLLCPVRGLRAVLSSLEGLLASAASKVLSLLSALGGGWFWLAYRYVGDLWKTHRRRHSGPGEAPHEIDLGRSYRTVNVSTTPVVTHDHTRSHTI